MESTTLLTMVVYYIFILFWSSYALMEEPKCFSKFDFEEKVLEKLVRTEHKMELYEETMRQKISTLNNERDTMQTMIGTFQSEISDMTQTLAAMEEQNDRMTQDAVVREIRINQVLNTTLERAIADVQNVADQMITPTVAFQARSPTNANPSNGERLIFETVLLNQGDGYDASTGVFTAHVPGLYIFSIQLSILNGKILNVKFQKNNDGIGAFQAGDGQWHSSNSGFAITDLAIGDTLSVIINDGSATPIYVGDHHFWNSFSGILVNSKGLL